MFGVRYSLFPPDHDVEFLWKEGGPVQDYGDGSGSAVGEGLQQQESFSIRRHVIVSAARLIDIHSRVKQNAWNAGLDSALSRDNVDSRDISVGRHIEQLLPVAPPARFSAAVVRKRALLIRRRKRDQVNLVCSRFAGTVGQPAAVGGEFGTQIQCR